MSTIFTTLNQSDDIVTNVPNRVTYGMWSNGAGSLTTFYTSSEQSSSFSTVGKYYHDIRSGSESGSAQVEFSIAYGHYKNSGSDSNDRDKAYQAVYSQYRNLLLDSKNEKFQMGDDSYLDSIYVINFSRSNIKEKLDAGNWELILSASDGIKLIDDSGDAADTKLTSLGEVFNIVSGTINGGVAAHGTEYFGLCYADYGILILDAAKLSIDETIAQWSGSINTLSGSDNDGYYNNNLSAFYNAIVSGASFTARSEELISSAHYFIRVKNKQYNYSSNPTFYSSSDGTLLYDDFQTNPKTFITTVGLYNDDGDMLAVAKTSQPIEKSFGSECLLKIRLDF